MTLTIIEAELEGKTRQWWDSIRDDIGEPSKRRSALVRVDEGHYILCLPDAITREMATHLATAWTDYNPDGPKLLVFSNTVFVPKLEDSEDGDQGSSDDQDAGRTDSADGGGPPGRDDPADVAQGEGQLHGGDAEPARKANRRKRRRTS